MVSLLDRIDGPGSSGGRGVPEWAHVPPLSRDRYLPWFVAGLFFWPLLLVSLFKYVDDRRTHAAALQEFRQGIEPEWYWEGLSGPGGARVVGERRSGRGFLGFLVALVVLVVSIALVLGGLALLKMGPLSGSSDDTISDLGETDTISDLNGNPAGSYSDPFSGDWMLTEGVSPSGVSFAPLEGYPVILALPGDGSFSLSGGCNNVTGTATVSEGSALFSATAYTAMVCDQAVVDVEVLYVESIGQTYNATSSGDVLTLFSSGGYLTFVR